MSTYSVSAYGFMIADSVRIESYAEALRRAVTGDSVVLDLGAGTGILSLLAARYGARKVFAVEPADAIEVARQAAAANGLADRIEFFQDLSTRLTLPEKADIVICDLRGRLPFLGNNMAAIADARDRLMKPGGILIPRRDVVRVALVEAEAAWRENLDHWDKYGFDMSAARRIVTNTIGWKVSDLKGENLISGPRTWAEIDYLTVSDSDFAAKLELEIERAGVAHGLSVWFDTMLLDEVRFSNAPDSDRRAKVYGSSFFPLSEPVAVNRGDTVSLRIEARLVGDDYIYRWDTVFRSGTDPGRILAQFNQSTFWGAPLSLAQLKKQREDHRPALNVEGRIDLFILERMKAGMLLGEIADELLAAFPREFASRRQALSRVTRLSRNYSE